MTIRGKFASRDELADAILAELEGAQLGGVDGVGANSDSEYEVVDWSVEED